MSIANDITHSQRHLMSKYGQVVVDIIKRIEREEWKVGQAILPVTELRKHYSCNRLTVLKALKELQSQGYLSVEQGRGTFVKRARVKPYIGVLLGQDIFNPHSSPVWSLLAKAAQDFFHDQGNELKFYIEHAHLSEESVLDRGLTVDAERGFLRGLLTVASDAPLEIAKSKFWQDHRIPWVDISIFDVAAHRVSADRLAMFEIGLDYFRQQGARCVAALDLRDDANLKEIPDFTSMVAQRGLETRPEWFPIHSGSIPTEESGYRGMQAIWKSREKPDALLIADDIMGKGAVQAILQLGIKVPDTLKVVCLANKGSGIFYPIAMPKLEYDPEEFVKETGDMLLGLMKDPALPPQLKLIRPVLRLEG